MNLTEQEITDIIEENVRRKRAYFRKVDQIIGDKESEVVKRRPMVIGGTTFYLPEEVWKDPFVKKYRLYKDNPEQMLRDAGMMPSKERVAGIIDELFQIRLKGDFEFWAITCCKIQDKKTKRLVPLVLNRGQRRLIKSYEDKRLAGKSIRIVLVKSRQWGGSTATDAYMTWINLYHREAWHTCIVAINQTQAINIRTMMKTIIKELPDFHEKTSFERFEGTETIRIIPERGTRVQIGSSTNPDALRSFDFGMLHLSEVGLWKETKEIKPEALVQSLFSCVIDEPLSMIVLESTAKGIGGLFYDYFQEAKKNKKAGLDGFLPVFVSWFDIELYTMYIHEHRGFVRRMTEYNWWQWRQGATLEGIKWYNTTKRANKYNDFQMKSEYPTTAEEAFQSTSSRYFSDKMLESIKANVSEPVFVGDIRGASPVGEMALQDIQLASGVDSDDSTLKVWIHPHDGIEPGMVAKNRFVVTVDVGGRHFKSDNSVISVFDRLSLAGEAGALERAALWKGHVDPDILAYKAAQIASYYDNAMLVIESNTYDSRYKKKSDNVDDGDHSYTVLDTIAEIYDNLYQRRTAPDSSVDRAIKKIGWHMNKQTKLTAYDFYYATIRQGDYVEYSEEAYEEAAFLTLNTKGQIEAAEGCHDDIQDTTAVGCYIAYNSMPRVRLYDEEYLKKKEHHYLEGSGVASF